MTASEINFREIDQARKILGLGQKASLAEIKEAYRKLSRQWHPDKCPKKNKKLCHEKMVEINRAYKLILRYVEDYRYSFDEDELAEESPAEQWRRQFGGDPFWGQGKE